VPTSITNNSGTELTYEPPINLQDCRLLWKHYGINIEDSLNLDALTFRLLLIDAVTNEMAQTDEGIKALNSFGNCHKGGSYDYNELANKLRKGVDIFD
jgi:hypothetical protein